MWCSSSSVLALRKTRRLRLGSRFSNSASSNPLVFDHLPIFSKVTPECVEPATQQLTDAFVADLESLEKEIDSKSPSDLSWSNVIDPLEKISSGLSEGWGLVGHLHSVKNTEELRVAYQKMQPAVVGVAARAAQSQTLFKAYKTLREGSFWNTADQCKKRVLESAIRDAEEGGVGLSSSQREAFNALQQEKASLCASFSNNVMDATAAFERTLTSRGDVEGLPPSALAHAASEARSRGHENATVEEGPWTITLDMPSYLPVMQHCSNRELREEVYRAFVRRGAEPAHDNSGHIVRILQIRRDMAAMLGHASYADQSLKGKMAGKVKAVTRMIGDLERRSVSRAAAELEEVKAFAAAGGLPSSDLKPWDVSLWSERLRKQTLDVDDEMLRPYFPLPKVLDGLFALCERLFDVSVRPVGSSAGGSAGDVWHPDVALYEVVGRRSGRPIARFYLDPYSRPGEKQGGAWMNVCVSRSAVMAPPGEDVRLPVAYLVCNGSAPADGKPSLMTFREVETLFHEFGHGLQHMLTSVSVAGAAGINGVEWDAVELPSQLMENFCYDPDTVAAISGHIETGESLPAHLLSRLRTGRTFMAATQLRRQLYFSDLDLQLHHTHDASLPSSAVFDLQHRLGSKYLSLPPLPDDRFLASFSHIFAGGYAAGYYSYKWAEVLSADAFGAFQEAIDMQKIRDETSASSHSGVPAGATGADQLRSRDPKNDLVASVGLKFRDTVLGLGGSVHPMEAFKMFRGREPTTDALLQQAGLL